MQAENYVYYMHFLVLNGSEKKCARARSYIRLFYSKSILTALIPLENIS